MQQHYWERAVQKPETPSAKPGAVYLICPPVRKTKKQTKKSNLDKNSRQLLIQIIKAWRGIWSAVDSLTTVLPK